MFKGKKRFQSLQTLNKADAMRRWPAAIQELEDRYGAMSHIARDPQGRFLRPFDIVEVSFLENQYEPRDQWRLGDPQEVQAIDLFDEDQLLPEIEKAFGWDEAIEIAKARHKRRRGRSMSSDALDAIKQALK
jgi:hypothetical protein